MQSTYRIILTASVCVLVCTHGIGLLGDDFTHEEVKFFEAKVRPVLIEHCLECHGPDEAENDLRLDSRTAILKGSVNGKVVTLDQPKKSPLVQAIHYSGDNDMPPNGKLSDKEIADLTTWVKMGLPWPESTAAIAKLSMPELMEQQRSSHWSFQKVVAPEIPNTKGNQSTDLDRFVLEKLENRGLTPSPRADKRTLIRRAYFDLIGLPPTYEEVEAFVNNDDPDAYSKLIDSLLESPHYGERWARHWLDVARYSDTSGRPTHHARRRYPFAFTYRDYVIDAFNRDLPYDQFIREQLAADQMELSEDKGSLAAMGFLTVGREFSSEVDRHDDKIDVVTRGFMGLTVSCARCHDHKYDAIPTEDYYSLYGIFANSIQPGTLPLIGHPDEVAKFSQYFDKRKKLEDKINGFRENKHKKIRKHIRDHFVDYLVRYVERTKNFKVDQYDFLKLEDVYVRRRVIDKWRSYLDKRFKSSPLVMQPLVELVLLPDETFPELSQAVLKGWSEGKRKVNPILMKELQSVPLKSKAEIGAVLAYLFDRIYTKWEKGGAKEPAIAQFKGHEKQIAELVLGKKSPAMLPVLDVGTYLNVTESNELDKMRGEIRALDTNAPDGIRRAMTLQDRAKMSDPEVMIRGNKNNLGETVPRRFVALISESESRPEYKKRSGRLELANAIASKDNPLTARVLVNRVWMHHFSMPLVDTPSDFGIRCEAPLQQDLLDYLAHEFMKQGWSIKSLHRLIMNSDTYCQSSKDISENIETDPENRLLWKMNRRRLEFEPLRDSMLSAAGRLDKTLYGKAVELTKRPYSQRRTIYGLIDRQDLPNLFRAFDLPNPDQSAAMRIRTSVPQQSLYMLNSPFVLDQARNLIQGMPRFNEGNIRKQKLNWVYRRLFQRNPTPQEFEVANQFIDAANQKQGPQDLGIWQRYAQLLLCTNEFEFID